MLNVAHQTDPLHRVAFFQFLCHAMMLRFLCYQRLEFVHRAAIQLVQIVVQLAIPKQLHQFLRQVLLHVPQTRCAPFAVLRLYQIGVHLAVRPLVVIHFLRQFCHL